jgi:PTS system D-glucosamine-specific IIA component/PTS system glucose-specific IIA component
MFGLLKKKKNEGAEKNTFSLVSAIDGTLIPLSEVPDPVFAEKMAGDGIAIDPTGDFVVAPADGELSLVFKTKHAFALTLENGIELLVHVGLETVSLNGEGFEQLIEAGVMVKAGTPILKIDREFIKSKGCALITPMLITNPDITTSITPVENIKATAGSTVAVNYTL